MTHKAGFRTWHKDHPNFMTPEIIEIFEKGDKVVEISRGTGFEDEPIFGVTKLRKTSTGYNSLGGKMFYTIDEARSFAKKMKEEL